MTYERSRGDRYALSALRNRRATLASEIVELERQLRHRRDSLVHVDATLKLLDPSIAVDDIPNKRLPKRIKLFRQGELQRLILGALREADRPLPTADVVTAVLAAGGHGESARRTMALRVRGNLSYQERRGLVEKIGDREAARWNIRERGT